MIVFALFFHVQQLDCRHRASAWGHDESTKKILTSEDSWSRINRNQGRLYHVSDGTGDRLPYANTPSYSRIPKSTTHQERTRIRQTSLDCVRAPCHRNLYRPSCPDHHASHAVASPQHLSPTRPFPPQAPECPHYASEARHMRARKTVRCHRHPSRTHLHLPRRWRGS